MALRTAFTGLFSLQHPIALAPMGGASGGALAAAVSNGGGWGLIGGARADPAWVAREMEIAAGKTGKPWGVGFHGGEETERSRVSDIAIGAPWPSKYPARTLRNPFFDQWRGPARHRCPRRRHRGRWRGRAIRGCPAGRRPVARGAGRPVVGGTPRAVRAPGWPGLGGRSQGRRCCVRTTPGCRTPRSGGSAGSVTG